MYVSTYLTYPTYFFFFASDERVPKANESVGRATIEKLQAHTAALRQETVLFQAPLVPL